MEGEAAWHIGGAQERSLRLSFVLNPIYQSPPRGLLNSEGERLNLEKTFPPPAFPAQEREYITRWGGAGTEGGKESPGERPGGPPWREMNPALRERTLFLSRVQACAGGEKPDQIASPSPLPGTVQLPAASAQVKWPQPRLGQLGSPLSPDPSPGPLGMATPALPIPDR